MENTLYDTLSKYNDELNRAVYCGYARNMTTNNRRELAAVYKALFNQEPNDLLNGCSACLFNALKRLGNAYFQEKEKREKMESEKPVIQEKVDTEEISKETSIEEIEEETEKYIEEYGTIDGLPVPEDTPEQLPAPDVTPEKENVTPKKEVKNKKQTPKKK